MASYHFTFFCYPGLQHGQRFMSPKRQRVSPSEDEDQSVALFTNQFAHSNKVYLFHHPSTKGLAKQVCALHPEKIILGEVIWETFPDGFPNLCIDPGHCNAMQSEGVSTCFLGSFRDPHAIFEQVIPVTPFENPDSYPF